MNTAIQPAKSSFAAEPLNWVAFFGLMTLVGTRQMWYLQTWQFSGFTGDFGGVGAVFPALVAVFVLKYRKGGLATLKKVYEYNRSLLFIVTGLFFWMLLRALSLGDMAVFISVVALVSVVIFEISPWVLIESVRKKETDGVDGVLTSAQ